MDMDAPIISRTVLLFAWAVVGIAAALFFTFVKLVRGNPPLTTQTDQVTGIRHHGIMTWALFFLAVFPGPPVAILAAGWMVNHWWTIPVVGFIAIGAVFVKRWQVQPLEQEYAPVIPVRHVPYVEEVPTQQLAPVQPEMWSAPKVEGNWDPTRPA